MLPLMPFNLVSEASMKRAKKQTKKKQYSISTGHILKLNDNKVNFFSKHRSIGFVQAVCWIALLSMLRTDILREPKYNRITHSLTISHFIVRGSVA